MSKTIEDDLPEEQGEYDINYHANKLYCALHDITELMRKVKKGWVDETEGLYNEKLFERLRDIISESGYDELQ